MIGSVITTVHPDVEYAGAVPGQCEAGNGYRINRYGGGAAAYLVGGAINAALQAAYFATFPAGAFHQSNFVEGDWSTAGIATRIASVSVPKARGLFTGIYDFPDTTTQATNNARYALLKDHIDYLTCASYSANASAMNAGAEAFLRLQLDECFRLAAIDGKRVVVEVSPHSHPPKVAVPNAVNLRRLEIANEQAAIAGRSFDVVVWSDEGGSAHTASQVAAIVAYANGAGATPGVAASPPQAAGVAGTVPPAGTIVDAFRSYGPIDLSAAGFRVDVSVGASTAVAGARVTARSVTGLAFDYVVPSGVAAGASVFCSLVDADGDVVAVHRWAVAAAVTAGGLTTQQAADLSAIKRVLSAK